MAIWTLEDAEKQTGIKIQSTPKTNIWDLESAESFSKYEPSIKPTTTLTSTKEQIEPTKKVSEGPSIFKKVGDFFISLVPKQAKEEIGKVREELTKGFERINVRDVIPGLSFFAPKPAYAPEPELKPIYPKGKEPKIEIKKEEKQTIEKLQKDYESSLIGKFDDKFQTVKNKFITGLTGGIIKPKEKLNPDLTDKIIGSIAEISGTALAIGKIGAVFDGIITSTKTFQTFFNSYPRLARYVYPLVKNVVSFSAYGQLDPDLKDRFTQLKNDIITSVPFTALGFVEKARYSIPASFGLGYGMAKLHGATDEDAFVSGGVLAVLDAWGRSKGKFKDFISGRKTDRILSQEAVRVINQYSDVKIKVGDPIEKINEAYRSASKKIHPDIIKDPSPQRAVNSAYEFLTGKSKKLNLDILKEGKYNSQDVINEVVKSGLDKTEEGKAIIKAALEAENKGSDILITKTKPEFKPQETKPETKIPDVITEELNKKTIDKFKENVKGFDSVENAKKIIEYDYKGNENSQVGFLPADKVFGRGTAEEIIVQETIKKINEGKKVEPVLLEKEGNNLVVLSGNDTFEAFKRLGKEIPVIYNGEDKIEGLVKAKDIYNNIPIKEEKPSSLPSPTEEKPKVEAKPEEKIEVEESRGEVEKVEIPKEKIEITKDKIDLYRGAKDHTIDVSRPNGITGGVSFSLSKEVAQRFAGKVEGTVKEYQLKEGAKIVNHSVLEEMVKDIPMELKEKAVRKIIKDNNIDAIRFDIPDKAKGEEEIRIVNDKAIEVKEEKKPEEIKSISKKEIKDQTKAIADALKDIKSIPIYKAFKKLKEYDSIIIIENNPNSFSDGHFMLLDRPVDEIQEWIDNIYKSLKYEKEKRVFTMEEITDKMKIIPKSTEGLNDVEFIALISKEDKSFSYPLSLLRVGDNQYAFVNSIALKWLNKEGYQIKAYKQEEQLYDKPLILVRNNKIAGAIMPVRISDEELDKILDKYGKKSKIEVYESDKVSRVQSGEEKVSDTVGVGERESANIERSGVVSGEEQRRDLERTGIAGERSSTRIKEQIELNKRIEELVKQKGDKRENYTSDEIELLKKYTGAGGLGINERGVLDEYYTPKPVIDFIWKRVENILGKSIDKIEGKFLEPSVGIGRFLEEKPANKFTAYEISEITSKITKVLYPEAQVINAPFENIFMSKNGIVRSYSPEYKIIVGNPPYGEHRGLYKGLGEEPKIAKYEDYFLKRGIDLLENGGILAYVMPSGFMKRSVNYAKETISSKATLIEAFRLPNGIFGTTDIGTDILIFQKGKSMDPLILSDDNYFNKKPENILGTISDKKDRFGEPIIEGSLKDLEEKLNEIIEIDTFKKLPEIEKNPPPIPTSQLPEDKPLGTGSRTKQEDHIIKQSRNEFFIIGGKKDNIISLSNIAEKEKEKWKNILPNGEFDIDYIRKEFKNFKTLKDFYSEDIGVFVDNGINRFYPKELYYSGNIYEKLDNLEANKHLFNEKQYEYQKNKLKEILPTPKKMNEIYLKPNDESFVKTLNILEIRDDGSKYEYSLINKFEEWLSDLPREVFEDSSEWEILDYISGRIVNVGDKLRNNEIRKRRRRIGDKLFNRFLREELDEKNRKIIEDKFNRTFNNYVKPDYNKIPLLSKIYDTFKGEKLKLRDLQKEGASFLASRGVGLIAYDVGLGKTLTSIVALNEVMERGWVKRPLIIVQNSTYNQWLKELQEIIPNVKINSLANLGGKFKGNLLNLKIEDKTISLITYDGFSKIGFREETYNKLIGELKDTISEGGGVRKEQIIKSKAEEMIGEGMRGTNGFKFFEDFGFDHLIIDEIHNFKNIFTGAKIERGQRNEYRNVRGSSSMRGIKLYLATQYILEKNNGRGVFGLSATPFTNNPLEIYSIISLFGKKKLEEMGLKNVNHFMSMFMNLQSKLILKANQDVVEEDVIESFKNLEQLQKIVSQFIDFRTGDEVGIKRPNKYKKPITLSPNKYQVEMIKKAQDLFLPSPDGKTGPIVAITELQNITLSPYLSRYANDEIIDLPPLNYKSFVELSPKIKYTVEILAENYKANKNLNQVIYMPRGVEYFRFLKEYLIKEKKIPADKIGEIIGGMSSDKRTEIQNAFNSGKIRILLGTEAIKEGINLQEKSTDLFYLHLPWNPTDILQVEGRIWRFGNMWKNVRIHYPLIENSVDSFIFQKLETKEKRIKNIWSYKGQEIEIGDLDFENMKLDLITDPVIKVKAEKEFEMAKKKHELLILKSEAAFNLRRVKDYLELKEEIKKVSEYKKNAMERGDDSDVAYWTKSIIEKEQKLKKLLERYKKQGIDIDGLIEKNKKYEEKIKEEEKKYDELEDYYDKKLKEAEKQRIDIITKENNYEAFINSIIEENKKFLEVIKKPAFEYAKAPPKGSFKGEFSDIESVEKKIGKIQAVEFPELVRLARELTGKYPLVKKLQDGVLGRFSEGKKEIALDLSIFSNPKITGKVLAHEIGHLADYLPDLTSSRGNIVGRIASLKKHLKRLYGELDNKVIKEELKALTKLWAPFDDSNPNFSYVKYRYSPEELYADAISVLFNDPALLKEKAPNFWKGFFNYLDRKPEVKENFFKIWDLLNKGEDEVYKERDKEVSEMFSKAEEKYTALHLERELRKKDFLYNIKLLFDDVNTPIIEKIKELEKKGIKIPPKLNPDYALKGLLYSDAEVKNFVEDNFGEIFTEANKIENGWEKLGKILFYERVINERGDLANPLGYQPDTAQFNLDKLQAQETPENWEKLQSLKEKFREGIQKIIDLAEKEGYYSSEMIAQMKANPSYATFQVIDYLDTYISSKVYHQIGTLKEVANPATATVMKAISTYKAIKRNKVKKINIEFLKEYFKDEIKDAQLKWNGKTMEIKPPKDEFEGLVIVMEDGKPKGYYVDKDVADMLNYQNEKTLELLGELSRKISASPFYRPLFTTYNIGFQTFNFVRDFQRAWKNYPQKTLSDVPLSPFVDFVKILKNYTKAVKPAVKSAFGLKDELIKEMENANILGFTYNDIFGGKVEPEMKQIERIMEGYGLFLRPKKYKLLKPIINVLDTVGKVGDVIEKLPKVAAYIDLKSKFSEEDMPLLAEIIRTQIGSPAFRVKGKATPITNSIFLFSNAIKEGLKVDFQVGTGKRGKATGSAFWYKTMLVNLLPKIILFGMVAGFLGDKIKKMVDNISEYDKTNYNVIPLGMDEKGKTVYLRIPQDETGRFLGGIFWKIMNVNKDSQGIVKSIMDIMSFGAGQFPNLSPAFVGWGALISYLSGNNPYDYFRNRNIIPDQEFKAGWRRSLPIFMDWFIKNQGLGVMFPSYNPKDPTALEKVLSAPVISNILGRWIKVSDKGKREKLEAISQKEAQKKAERYLQIRETIDDMVKEYKKNPSVLKRYELEKQLIKKFYEKGMDESEKTRLKKRLRVAIERGKDDPYINALINASSNNEKAMIMVEIEKELGQAQFSELVKSARKVGIIGSDAVRLYKQKRSEK